MINKTVISILSLILICSVIFNIYFLFHNGIIINKDYSVTNNNSQWQGQILINQWAAQGNIIEWKVIDCLTKDQLSIELNKLHPISSMYCKSIIYETPFNKYNYKLIYPDIFTKIKEVQK